ncbi:hypothetical protein Ais01nite_08880 [Asanoa ishikariensis]|uniref:Ig-like domain-containing protein n=1 Tax=Asanoa ishikariensis TaxID=137265 RepID=A0A1H3T8P5_9ACTN|nr:hypothetical protein [Asanoa ishikariensis]GIF62853.1 hypothetical protein Ais01nite_08880 [Asanoa ishikariensis]SDZ46604.1 hypothetical protein SAMN05421684_5345 [Asanoa ishikariensis]
MSGRTITARLAVVGAVAAAVTAIAAAPAQAGIYTWKFQGSQASNADCVAAGTAAVRTGDADVYRCSGAAGTELYFGYVW